MQKFIDYQKKENPDIETFDIQDIAGKHFHIDKINNPFIIRTENDVYTVEAMLNKNYLYVLHIRGTKNVGMYGKPHDRKGKSLKERIKQIMEFESLKYPVGK